MLFMWPWKKKKKKLEVTDKLLKSIFDQYLLSTEKTISIDSRTIDRIEVYKPTYCKVFFKGPWFLHVSYDIHAVDGKFQKAWNISMGHKVTRGLIPIYFNGSIINEEYKKTFYSVLAQIR